MCSSDLSIVGRPTDPGDSAAQGSEQAREQKMAALNYVQEAWAEARHDGVDDDCMAMTCLFAAFAELPFGGSNCYPAPAR